MTNQDNISSINDEMDAERQPLHVWMPTVLLKFLVFLAFAFVIFQAITGQQDLSSNRLWATVAGMVGLLLLLAIDRLTSLRVSATGVEATLTQFKVQAMAEIDSLDNREAAEMARAQILQAKNPAQIEAARTMAVELNVNQIIDQVEEAIQQKRKLYIRYRPDPKGSIETYTCAPLDVKPGRTSATKANDYLWVYSDEHGRPISLRLGKVQGVEMSQETFDPEEVMKSWKTKNIEWNLARDW